jgi:GT2 family glycosyltransferase
MLEADKGYDIISTGLQFFGNKVGKLKPPPTPSHSEFLVRNQINCCSMYRKIMWEKVGGYDEKMRDGFEDYDFWLRCTAVGYKVRVIQEPLFFYRRHGPSMITHARENKQKIMAYLRTKFPTVGVLQK